MLVAKSQDLLVLMRVPYLEKAPYLCYLLEILAGKGYRIRVVIPREADYLPPAFADSRIAVHFVSPRGGHFEWGKIPTTVRMLLGAFWLCLCKRPAFLLGADKWGGTIAYLLSKLFRLPCIQFPIEYPPKKTDLRTWSERLEHRFLRKADFVITFDDLHREFLGKEVGVQRGKCLIFPNSTGPRIAGDRDGALRRNLGIGNGEVLLMHAGGFGPWFNSMDLARAAQRWPGNWRLVFHTSHSVEKTDYAKGFSAEKLKPKVILHSKPVPRGELDGLLRDADIGLALYSKEKLGFRAELLGLAAGKIGTYLKNGIPVIVQDLSSIRAYVDKYECGICVSGPEEVASAATTILANYKKYRQNAFRCYDELWDLTPYTQVILERLEMLSRPAKGLPTESTASADTKA